MDTESSAPHGFGTTSEEWALLQVAYNVAVAVASGQTPAEETLAKFRYLDERGNLMFDSWWNSRPEF